MDASNDARAEAAIDKVLQESEESAREALRGVESSEEEFYRLQLFAIESMIANLPVATNASALRSMVSEVKNRVDMG